MHEFEALLFSDCGILAEVLQQPQSGAVFSGIVTECGEPEAIDDDPATAPSKRILSVVPGYQKVLHGPIAAQRIGLDKLRQACPHFDAWVRKLEVLGPGG